MLTLVATPKIKMTDEANKNNQSPDLQKRTTNQEGHKQVERNFLKKFIKPCEEFIYKERTKRIVKEEISNLFESIPQGTLSNKKIEKIITKKIEIHQNNFYKNLRIFLGPCTILIVALLGSVAISYQNEIQKLNSYKEELYAEIIGKNGTADIQLLSIDNKVLDENTNVNVIRAVAVHENLEGKPYNKKKYRLIIPIQFLNKGNGIPKNIAIKADFANLSQYIEDSFAVDIGNNKKYDIHGTDVIDDSESLKYRKFLTILPKDERFTHQEYIDVDKIPKDGSYDVSIRVFYGDNYSQSNSTKFKLVVNRKIFQVIEN